MAIGVYRIYVSCLWTGDALARLVTALDALPGLLYRIDRVPDEDLAAAAGSDEALRSALRVAMTQSHVAIVRIDGACEATPLGHIERDLARSSFRRRIPVVGVAETATEEASAEVAAAHETDRLVPLDSECLAIAIQDLAEQAAAERRRANDALLRAPLKAVPSEPRMFEPAVPPAEISTNPAAGMSDAPRELPVAEIMEALASLKAARGAMKPPI